MLRAGTRTGSVLALSDYMEIKAAGLVIILMRLDVYRYMLQEETSML